MGRARLGLYKGRLPYRLIVGAAVRRHVVGLCLSCQRGYAIESAIAREGCCDL